MILDVESLRGNRSDTTDRELIVDGCEERREDFSESLTRSGGSTGSCGAVQAVADCGAGGMSSRLNGGRGARGGMKKLRTGGERTCTNTDPKYPGQIAEYGQG